MAVRVDPAAQALAIEVLRARERAPVPANPYVEYRTDPVRFCVERLHVAERTLRWSLNPGYDGWRWDGTREPIAAMMQGIADGHDVGVEAATGTGKSFGAACLIYWFNACWENSLVYTFAPVEAQLTRYIWREMALLLPAFQAMYPDAVLLELRLRVRGGTDNTWGAEGVAVGLRANETGGVAVRAAGMHAEDMLLIYEEAPGQSPTVLEAGENTCTAPHNLRLAIGNPDSMSDALHTFTYDVRGKARPNVVPIRISALDHPNVVSRDSSIVPGAVSALSIERRRARYGEEGRLYTSRVRGISPAESKEALIKLEWVRRAQARWEPGEDRLILEKVGKGRKSLGVDVANSESGDEGAISRWTGAVCREVETKPCPNANVLGHQVHLEMQRENIDVQHVGVDGVGVGAGAVNELLRFGKYVRSLLGGAAAEGPPDGKPSEEQFLNLRCQMWWTLREDLRLDRIALPPNDELAMDLITPEWETRNGKIVVESKETLCDRLPGGRSPNAGDSVAMGNFVRPRDVVATEIPKRPPTLQERVFAEIQKLERQDGQGPAPRPKSYGPLLRG